MINKKENKGFTLIELIIVMAIISILIVIAGPKYVDYVNHTKLTQIKNDTKIIENNYKTKRVNLLINDKDDDSFLTTTKIDRGLNIESNNLKDIKKINGVKLNNSFKKELKSKLPGDFYYNKEKDEVFYYTDDMAGIKIVETDIDNN